jgi:hypothetical protein
VFGHIALVFSKGLGCHARKIDRHRRMDAKYNKKIVGIGFMDHNMNLTGNVEFMS